MGLLGGEKGYPIKETSGTSFYTFGLTWGMNNGFLDKKEYTPVIEKSWSALTKCVRADGLLGYVQPVGAAPGDSFADKSEVYGVGAFLAAGSEIISRGCLTWHCLVRRCCSFPTALCLRRLLGIGKFDSKSPILGGSECGFLFCLVGNKRDEAIRRMGRTRWWPIYVYLRAGLSALSDLFCWLFTCMEVDELARESLSSIHLLF